MEYLVEELKAHYRRAAPPTMLTRPPSEGLKQPINPSSDMEKSQQKAA
jgi:hypothetical protein